MSDKRIFTSESVTEGHPDKVSDRISDSVLDALLEGDKFSRVACETLTNTQLAVIAGEITSQTELDYDKVVRQAIKEIGYSSDEMGYNFRTCDVKVHIDQQSPDIAQGVTEGKGLHRDQGAGDQGMMFGYACKETDSLMPAPIDLSHKLVMQHARLRKTKELEWLRPDAKSQVSLIYSDDGKNIEGVSAIVLSTQHDPDISQEDLKKEVLEKIITPVIPEELISSETKIFINPTGKFVIGGPVGDCGLTGRKVEVDTYGGMSRHGGGAFSGKDPTKVDRSAAYAARYVAKNIVASNLADWCEVQISYAIGIAEPTSLNINTYGSNRLDNEKIIKLVRENFDLRPKGIIKMLDLKKPIYKNTAAYGHFGREDQGFSWELKDRLKNI